MEIVTTFCDRCNIDTDTDKVVRLNADICSVLGIVVPAGEDHVFVRRGVFGGPFAAAQQVGWQDRDYGHCCPMCAAEEREEEEVGDSSVGLEALEDALVSDKK